jgi:transcriptional regulator with XRE-family HTH domain
MRDASAQWELDKFGAALRAVREQQGMSQRALADAAGLHRTTLSAIERGRRDPTFVTLVKLRRGLGDGLSDVFALCEAGGTAEAKDGDA